jgi:hypothetical protein
MAKLGIYNAEEVSIFVNLVPIGKGLSREGFLTITKTNPDYTANEGADGWVVRNAQNSKLHTAKIKLLSVSPDNATLSALRLAGLAAGNGADVGPFMAKNNLGEFLLVGDCWIMAPPEVEYGSEAGEREWQIQVVEKTVLYGA